MSAQHSDGLVAQIKGLSITFHGRTKIEAVKNVSIEIGRGEIVGLVGESGSGKSLTAMALAGLLPAKNCELRADTIKLGDHDVLGLPREELRQLRGKKIAYVFQEPMTALNPTMRIGNLMVEVIKRHSKLSTQEATRLAERELETVSLPDCKRIMRSFPFELSGGMRQRVLVALAFSMRPDLLVADEPTTALDVTVQADIIRVLRRKARDTGASVLFISHDLPLVANTCTRIYVMQGGELLEGGPTRLVLNDPKKEYTRKLIESLPENCASRQQENISSGYAHPVSDVTDGSHQDDRCILRLHDISHSFVTSVDWLGRPRSKVVALNEASIDVKGGETFAIIGESGSGKTTLARVALGLVKPDSGSIESTADRQMVFQDPKSSMSPRMPVWRLITEPARIRKSISNSEARELAASLVEKVGIGTRRLDSYLHQFSGGQRQRLAIARALSDAPQILILDEPTSALDVSVQAQILNLLMKLQEEFGLTYLVISHDVGVVQLLSDRVAVMRQGKVVEVGAADDVLRRPSHPYTKALLEAVPSLQS